MMGIKHYSVGDMDVGPNHGLEENTKLYLQKYRPGRDHRGVEKPGSMEIQSLV